MINIFGFDYHIIFAASTHLSHCSETAAVDSTLGGIYIQ